MSPVSRARRLLSQQFLQLISEQRRTNNWHARILKISDFQDCTDRNGLYSHMLCKIFQQKYHGNHNKAAENTGNAKNASSAE